MFAFFAQHFTHQFFKTSGKMGRGFTKALGHGVRAWGEGAGLGAAGTRRWAQAGCRPTHTVCSRRWTWGTCMGTTCSGSTSCGSSKMGSSNFRYCTA